MAEAVEVMAAAVAMAEVGAMADSAGDIRRQPTRSMPLVPDKLTLTQTGSRDVDVAENLLAVN
jgi:hypothetical protein